ncbi:DNA-processing protein DprA [Idiomarina xiamenensis]|uniref:DNA uptake Rossmann fold nucleotide-binding protein n=1 Tax=Idiomarina xiamenensis 10-D-4 TaxID=740709 RepID=K2K6U5_9GAMM|nr:DNA-processing protein DprA [Idiomarina xiamenensis]EKE83383.1 DNA uptake Rossmann fold nucleotide-binding protein [Idiomarina xiamenensis 10-D-4]
MQQRLLALAMALASAPIQVQRRWAPMLTQRSSQAAIIAIEQDVDIQRRVVPLQRLAERFLGVKGRGWTHIGCRDYPTLLREIKRPPVILFYHGDIRLAQQPAVAIVGSRKASTTGLHNAAWLAQQCCQRGWVVVSGLAMGVDAAAHRSALAHGRAIAVLGVGCDYIYPRRNRLLQQQIAEQGLLLSEFIPGSPAKSDHFPRRNRIISGLSQVTTVVEATLASGSMTTAAYALEQNRDVAAFSGSMWNSAYDGCHRLIQQGAFLMTGEQGLDELLPILEKQPQPVVSSQKPMNKAPSSDNKGLASQKLLANVGNEATSLDRLVELTGLSIAEVSEQMLLLEIAGRVEAVPAGYIKMGRR